MLSLKFQSPEKLSLYTETDVFGFGGSMSRIEDVLDSLVEIRLTGPDSFQIIRETLTRIGIPNNRKRILFQSCHILSKSQKTKYYLVHFKELYALDGKFSSMDDEDRARRNRIAKLLEEWGLIEIVDPKKVENPLKSYVRVKIIPHEEKHKWELVPKYQIGVRK